MRATILILSALLFLGVTAGSAEADYNDRPCKQYQTHMHLDFAWISTAINDRYTFVFQCVDDLGL